MIRRTLLASALALGLSASALETAQARTGPAAPQPPNVVVIIADDLGYADVSTYQRGRIPTPNIDRIGKDGVVFTRGYVSAPICSPSRAGLMTGRHQQRFGFEYNNGPASRDRREELGLATTEITLADVLRARGYRTAAIGKWHLGSSDKHYPTRRGFDEFWGFLSGQTNFVRPDAPDAVNALAPAAEGAPRGDSLAEPFAAVNALNAVVTGPDRRRVDLGDGYLTEQITDQAIDFIDRSAGKPFFLYVAHHAPHTPLQTTRKYYDRFPQIADKDQRVYAGMVSALDDEVGRLYGHLRRKGLLRNTIVVFLSDNGCAAYLAGICSAEPLSGGKLTYLEGGVRVPFMLAWPAQLPAGRVYATPVSSLDIFPTVVKAAGAKLPDRTYDGVDILPRLRQGVAGPPRNFFWRTQPMAAVTSGDWKYVRDLDGAEHLYDLRRDPRELNDLAARNPETVARLRDMHAAWAADKVDPAWKARFTEFEFAGRKFRFTP